MQYDTAMVEEQRLRLNKGNWYAQPCYLRKRFGGLGCFDSLHHRAFAYIAALGTNTPVRRVPRTRYAFQAASLARVTTGLYPSPLRALASSSCLSKTSFRASQIALSSNCEANERKVAGKRFCYLYYRAGGSRRHRKSGTAAFPLAAFQRYCKSCLARWK